MRRSNPDPWAQVGYIAGIAALVGAGMGAGTALALSERRMDGVDARLRRLEERLERLETRVRTPG